MVHRKRKGWVERRNRRDNHFDLKMPINETDTDLLLQRIAEGDVQAKEELIAAHRPMLREFIRLRFDKVLGKRIDPSDVVQETLIEVSNRIDDFLMRRPMPFSTWLRKTAYQNLVRLRRVHLHTKRRTQLREVSIPRSGSLVIVESLLRPQDGPLDKLLRDEMVVRVEGVLQSLADEDRELILMRTCESLNNATAANILDMDPRLCSKRYARALIKVREGLRGNSNETSDYSV